MNLSRWLILALALAPVAGRGAPAPPPPAPTVDDCLACHGDPEATRSDGRKVAVDGTAFAASVHGQAGLACVDCHADLAKAELPHSEKLARVDCATCHGDAVAAYNKSVHAAERRSGDRVAATCIDCHGLHDIRGSKDPLSRTSHLKLPQTCGQCHGSAEKMARVGHPKSEVFATYEDSIHGQALEKAGLVVAPNCQNCHGNHDIRRVTDPESKVARANIPGTCGTCHQGIQQLYETSAHAAALRAGNLKAAVCADCHSAHAIKDVDLPAWKLSVIQECGTCHAESIRTYRDTFHGQVTKLGFVRVASCADCHGAHDVKKKSDPGSRVNHANLVQTCGRCHEGAGASFVRFDPHADAHDPDRNPVLFWTARFMKMLLAFVFTFFGVHTGLWLPRSWIERRKANGGGPAGEDHQ